MHHRDNLARPNHIGLALAGYAVSQPDRPAILAPGRQPLSYAALYQQQNYVCARFSEWGLGQGDPVAVILPKGPEMAVAIAVLPSCATVVPTDPNLSVPDYEKLFLRCGAKALVLPQGMPHNAREAADHAGLCQIDLITGPDMPAGAFELEGLHISRIGTVGRNLGKETALILSTSGSTSDRKLIPHPHNRLLVYAAGQGDWFRFEPGDLNIHLIPMYFSHGIKASLLVPLLNGTTIVCPDTYEATSFFRFLEEYRPTWMTAGFTVYRDILRHVDDYRHILAKLGLRFIRSGSGRLEPSEIRRLEDAFDAPVLIGLGSTETCALTCHPLPPRQRKTASVGLPLPRANEVAIRDDTRGFLDSGEEGEIVVRGPLVFDSYLDDPVATEQAFVDGWYRTGDVGKFDEDGFLYLTGRLKEIINCGGQKISPAEIDLHLESHDTVLEAASFGLPHATLGEVVVAAVVMKPGAGCDEKSIKQHVRGHLAAAKVPRKIYVVDHLPRAPNGKLQRHKLSGMVTPDR